MNPRVVGAALSAVLLLLVAVVHAASACTLREHSTPPCHATDGGRSADQAPACCQQPATMAATLESYRPDDGVQAFCALFAAVSPAIGASDLVARPAHGFDPFLGDRPKSDPRTHLLQTLLL